MWVYQRINDIRTSMIRDEWHTPCDLLGPGRFQRVGHGAHGARRTPWRLTSWSRRMRVWGNSARVNQEFFFTSSKTHKWGTMISAKGMGKSVWNRICLWLTLLLRIYFWIWWRLQHQDERKHVKTTKCFFYIKSDFIIFWNWEILRIFMAIFSGDMDPQLKWCWDLQWNSGARIFCYRKCSGVSRRVMFRAVETSILILVGDFISDLPYICKNINVYV